MNFCEWILCLNNRDTPTGDLSRDIEQDQAIRSVPNARRDLLCYLESMGASDGAIAAFKSAWTSYLAYCRRHSEE